MGQTNLFRIISSVTPNELAMKLRESTQQISSFNEAVKSLTGINEPRYEKTGFLHMRKQRRNADQLLGTFKDQK